VAEEELAVAHQKTQRLKVGQGYFLPFVIQGIGLSFFRQTITYITVYLHSIPINTPTNKKFLAILTLFW